MDIRTEIEGDAVRVRALVVAAFDRPAVADLASDLAAGDAHLCSLVAVDGVEIVGHVQVSRGWLDAADGLVAVAVLSPLSVAPHRQGAGLGGRLVRAALARAEAATVPAVFLEGDPAYYRRFGFVPGADVGCSAPSVRIPAWAFQVVTLAGYDPAMAGALVYPDAFWRFDCVGLR